MTKRQNGIGHGGGGSGRISSDSTSGFSNAASGSSRLRCAVYTRKSNEDGLEQEFNSLHAQREACSAFVMSQAGLGWKLLPDPYDDGGLSGGTMERPALQRLLADIRDGLVDVVVDYKIDRLTRSLMDFARIVDVFDSHGVSFVSVTQAFNTTTSMGRLTLNVLLSFAQFEREVTAERIRDKIAASKKKGMWMGGVVPLGYKAVNKKLIIDPTGAAKVRHIFSRYLQLKSVPMLAEELTAETLAAASGDAATDLAEQQPVAITRPGMLYNLLSNPVYIGKLRHKSQVHEGEHEAIINPTTFDQAQDLLAEQAPRGRGGACHPDIHLLSGMLFDEAGDRLSPVHASNHGKRYRYYVSSRIKGAKRKAGEGWRVPAGEIEKIVVQQLHAILSDRARLAGWISEHVGSAQVPAGLAATDAMLGRFAADNAEAAAHLGTVFRRIVLGPGNVCFQVDTTAIARWLTKTQDQLGSTNHRRHGSSRPRRSQPNKQQDQDSSMVAITVPLALKRRGFEARLVIEGDNAQQRKPDQPLINLLARAHAFLGALTDGSASNTVEVAALFGVHRAEVSRLLPLAFLSPTITQAILTGRQPVELSARKLGRDIDLPLLWSDQAQALGM